MTERRDGIDGVAERAAIERRYMEANGIKTLINSLSGGVDSSLSALVSKKASPEGTIALLLPCSSEAELQGERRQDLVDGQRVADHLQIPTVEINLSQIWQSAVDLLTLKANEMAERRGVALDEAKLQWAVNNLKPTLRMMSAGFFADAFAGLMIGTDNAVENFLGYFSIRGDGIADRQPIRDCTKGEVRMLAASGDYPADLVERVPTAGLWPGQTDEGELGFTYDQADAFLLWVLEQHLERQVMDGTMTVRAEAVERLLAHDNLPVPVEAARRIIAQNRRTGFKRQSDDLHTLLVRRRLL